MLRKLCAAFTVVIAFASANAAIDLTPAVHEYASEGFQYRQIQLKTDNGSVTFVAPLGWNVSGGKERLVMRPSRNNSADASVVASPLAAPVVYSEALSKTLEQQALAAVPPGSQSVALVSRDENPAMGRKTSVEFVVSYMALGHPFHRSVMFVYTDDTQLVFRLTAPKEEFATLHEALRHSVSCWEWTETKRGAAQTPAVASATATPASASQRN
jgi:hypothetical protein